MKKTITLGFAFLTGFTYSIAQEVGEKIEGTVTYDKCTKFFKSPPLRDLLPSLQVVSEADYDQDAPKVRRWQPYTHPDHADIGIPENNGMDPAAQTEMGKRSGEGMMKANFQGQGGATPPDPTGAAGPDQYVQAVNSSYKVYDKNGGSLTGSITLNSFFSEMDGSGDPIVMYDRFADRWFISQFTDPFASPYRILIAVSETSDALGSYFFYEFTFPQFPDYPKFGVWSNAYVMTTNTTSNDCVAFERDKMLLGDPGAAKIQMSFPSFPQFFNSVAPAYAEGPTEPDADEPAYFFAVQDNSFGGGITQDHIKVLKATFDWTTPANSSVVVHQSINTDAFNSTFTGSWDDLTQPFGSTQKLDAVTGIFMYRAQYRRFQDYNVVMLCHTVDVDNTNRAAVRWYELRDQNDGVWSIYQQGTYSPDTQNNRWMGSIGMDEFGNIALAYCFMGPNDYAGIRYTGRFANDPLGEMTVQEQIGVEGTGNQTTTNGNRYGDYSQMTLDPSDDHTFWFTGEYLGTSGARRTRIISFSSWHLAGQDEIQTVPFFNAYQPAPETVRVIWNDLEDETVEASIIDMNGKLIATSQINTQSDQQDFDVSSVAAGVYFVSLKGENTNLSQKIYLAR